MPNKKSDKRPLIKMPVNVDIERSKTHERKVLEFVPNTVKAGEAIIVRADKWGGILKPCFVVLNVDGKELIIKQLKEEKDKTS